MQTKKLFGKYTKLAAAFFVILLTTFFGVAIANAATLSFDKTSNTVNVGSNFTLNLLLNTSGSNAVAANAIINYDPTLVSVVSWDTNSSSFASGNTCINNGKFCNIETNDAVNGVLNIVAAKPSPGLNTSAGQMASIVFRSLATTSNNANAIKIKFLGSGNYTDSDVALDDGNGTDILTGVSTFNFTANPIATPTLSATLSALPSSGSAPVNSVSLTATVSGTQTGNINYTFYCDRADSGTNITQPYSIKVDNVSTNPYTASRLCSYANPGIYNAKVIVERGTSVVESRSTITVSQPGSSTKFSANDRVYVVSGPLNVRQAPSSSGTLAGTQATNALGTVIGGPIYADGYFWWNINFDSGVDGWVVESYIEKSTTSTTDTQAPTVSVTAPITGTTVSGSSVNVSANATDNVGVVGVQFKVDGINLGVEDVTSPYSLVWDTKGALNGSHVITAIARDAAGNQTTSAGVSVTVNNPVPDTQAPTVSVTAPITGTTVSGSSVNVSANATDNVGVVGVQFKVDGINLGVEDTASPYTTSWNTTTAVNGSHSITAIARDAAGNQTTSNSSIVTVNNVVPDTQAPSVPTGLAATVISVSQINLSWSASTDNVGVIGYRIYRNGTQVATASTNSYSNTGLTQGTTYVYTVAAYDAAGNVSAQSSSVSGTTQTATDIVPPVISSVSAVSLQPRKARIAWITDEPSDSTVYYSVNSTLLKPDSVANSNLVTSHNISVSSLGRGLKYYYKVVSKDASGNKSESAIGSFQVLPNPLPVANLTATKGSIRLNWDPISDPDVTKVEIYRNTTGYLNSPSGSPYAAISDANITTYLDTQVVNGTTYYYTVFAEASDGSYSDAATISFTATATTLAPDTTAPQVPTALTATAVSTSQINLVWGASTDPSTGSQEVSGVAGYKIYRNNALIATSVTTSYNDQGLTSATAYAYKVVAYDNAGNTSAGTQITISTLTPPVVTNTTTGGTLTLDISASPNKGDAPFTTTVTANVAGATSGITYSFYCNSGADVNITVPVTEKFENQTDTTKSKTCTFATPGTYFVKVSVEKGISKVVKIASVTATYPTVVRVGGSVVVNTPAGTGIGTGTVSGSGSTGSTGGLAGSNPYTQFGSYVTRKHLYVNSKGDDVSKLQEFLKLEGFYSGDITGFYGTLTRNAVGEFQLQHDVLSSNRSDGYGEVGVKTRTAMNTHLQAQALGTGSPTGTDNREQILALIKLLQQQLVIILAEYQKLIQK